MMNTASSPLDSYQSSLPHNGDPNYSSLPMQSFYVDGYPSHPVSRGSMMDQIPPSEALTPLASTTTALQPSAAMDTLPRSCIENGRKYELQVVQQPRRARMCGFGDKDRRPITPPPCVRLVITDVASGKEIDCNEIDHGMFILNVDLWAEDGTREVNLVRHSQTSPSISSTAAASFSDVTQAAAAYTNNPDPMRNEPPAPQFHFDAGPNQGHQFPVQSSYTSYPGPPPVNSYPQSPGPPPYGEVQYQQGFQTMNGAGYPQNGYPSGVPIYYGAGIHAQAQGGPQQGMDYGMVPQPLLGPPTMSPYDTAPFQPSEQGLQRNTSSQAPPSGMFTRNLIGSLAASAFRLTDPDDRIGIWFVLQDLSVRTEGHFRLRFSFVNVGATGAARSPTSDSMGSAMAIQSGLVNTGKAPVLAACLSETFSVYSAKKFPGVVESTHLSKCFATQGIKIPIRKDGPSGKGNKDKEDYDEED